MLLFDGCNHISIRLYINSAMYRIWEDHKSTIISVQLCMNGVKQGHYLPLHGFIMQPKDKLVTRNVTFMSIYSVPFALVGALGQ